MNQDNKTTDFISKFVEYAIIEGETKLSGNYKLGNKMAKELNKLLEIMKEDLNLAEYALGILMKKSNKSVSSIAAADALRLNIRIEEAVETLTEISMQNDIIGFGSEMTLRIWRGEFPGKTL